MSPTDKRAGNRPHPPQPHASTSRQPGPGIGVHVRGPSTDNLNPPSYERRQDTTLLGVPPFSRRDAANQPENEAHEQEEQARIAKAELRHQSNARILAMMHEHGIPSHDTRVKKSPKQMLSARYMKAPEGYLNH